MKKEDFKTVRSIATIGNLALAMFISAVATTVVYFIKPSSSTLILFTGFVGLFVLCSLLVLVAVRKLDSIKFEGTSRQLAEEAKRHAKFFFFPVIFAITMNKMRSAMWDWYIVDKTSHIDDPVERVKVNQIILEEINADGFISQKQYEDRLAKMPALLQQAEEWKAQAAKEKAEAKKQAAADKKAGKKPESEDDGWI